VSDDPRQRASPNVALAPVTTLGVGGPARHLVDALTAADVQAVSTWSRDEALPLFILGGGSNVVIADKGWGGIVLRVAIAGVETSGIGTSMRLRVGAGEPWDEFVERMVDRGLAGLECLSGIPGSVGGTPIQNVGAYGQEVSDVIESVTVCDLARSTIETLPAEACAFAYRTSRFKHADAGRYLVCGVTFRLREGAPTVTYPDVIAWLSGAGVASPTPADVRRAVIAVRRRKGMVLDADDSDTRSVGSFFTNPIVTFDARERMASVAGVPAPGYSSGDGGVKIPAGWLIERSGFDRLRRVGGAGVSSKHPLAIVNRGGATARDVVMLATEVKRRVLDRFGVPLRPEPVFVGFGVDPDVAFLQE
jgi:UDP-N-acetylmuramate dehydrogenase